MENNSASEDGELYYGSDTYEAPRTNPIPVKTKHSHEINNQTSLSSQISLQGSELIPDPIFHEKIEEEDKVFQVTGVIDLNGQPQEVSGTLKLLTDANGSIIKYNTGSINTVYEQRRPDVVPIHGIATTSTSNTNSSRSTTPIIQNLSQSSHSSRQNFDIRKTSYTIQSDEDTIQKVRSALKRSTDGNSDQNRRRSSQTQQGHIENIPMTTLNITSQQNGGQVSNVSAIFNSMVSKQVTLKGTEKNNRNPDSQTAYYQANRQSYNYPYELGYKGSNLDNNSLGNNNIYGNIGNTFIEEEPIGNRGNSTEELFNGPSSSRRSSISTRAPVPAPRSNVPQPIYEYII